MHEGLCLRVSFVGAIIVYGEGMGSVILSPAASTDLSWWNPMPLSRTASLPPPHRHLCPSPDPPPARAGLPPAPCMAPSKGTASFSGRPRGIKARITQSIVTKTIEMVSDSTLQVTFEKLPLLHFSLYRRKIAIVI